MDLQLELNVEKTNRVPVPELLQKIIYLKIKSPSFAFEKLKKVVKEDLLMT
jgi:hypothetical protein